mmetsp:Transcript_1157/g.3606  ORF Transcript_1157/g.3606 Transcript_1157/m.3606 type:complete len:242 (-) Transcript_1157:1415-2140(-)
MRTLRQSSPALWRLAARAPLACPLTAHVHARAEVDRVIGLTLVHVTRRRVQGQPSFHGHVRERASVEAQRARGHAPARPGRCARDTETLASCHGASMRRKGEEASPCTAGLQPKEHFVHPALRNHLECGAELPAQPHVSLPLCLTLALAGPAERTPAASVAPLGARGGGGLAQSRLPAGEHACSGQEEGAPGHKVLLAHAAPLARGHRAAGARVEGAKVIPLHARQQGIGHGCEFGNVENA